MENTNVLQQNIVTSLGLDSLPEDEQVRILDEIGRVIHQRVVLRVLDELSDEDKNTFDELLGKRGNNQNIIALFLKEKLPNLDRIVEEETAGFKAQAQEFMKRATGPASPSQGGGGASSTACTRELSHPNW